MTLDSFVIFREFSILFFLCVAFMPRVKFTAEASEQFLKGRDGGRDGWINCWMDRRIEGRSGQMGDEGWMDTCGKDVMYEREGI